MALIAVSVSLFMNAVGYGFMPWQGNTKDHHKMVQTTIPSCLTSRYWGRSLAVQSECKRPGCLWY